MGIRVNDQVMFRYRTLNETPVIKMGMVVSIQGAQAVVHFPVDRIRRTIPVDSLELVSDRYKGRARVQLNPLHR
jgi:hypothetical protein